MSFKKYYPTNLEYPYKYDPQDHPYNKYKDIFRHNDYTKYKNGKWFIEAENEQELDEYIQSKENQLSIYKYHEDFPKVSNNFIADPWLQYEGNFYFSFLVAFIQSRIYVRFKYGFYWFSLKQGRVYFFKFFILNQLFLLCNFMFSHQSHPIQIGYFKDSYYEDRIVFDLHKEFDLYQDAQKILRDDIYPTNEDYNWIKNKILYDKMQNKKEILQQTS